MIAEKFEMATTKIWKLETKVHMPLLIFGFVKTLP